MPKGKPKYNKPNIEVFTDLMRRRGGILSAVAKDLGIPFYLVHKWFNEDSEFRQSTLIGLHATFDIALSNVSTAIASGDLDTSKWFIEKLGKKLGFFEETEQKVTSKTRIILPKEFEQDNDDVETIDFENI